MNIPIFTVEMVFKVIKTCKGYLCISPIGFRRCGFNPVVPEFWS